MIEHIDLGRWMHPICPSERLGRRPVRVSLCGRPIEVARDAGGHAAVVRGPEGARVIERHGAIWFSTSEHCPEPDIDLEDFTRVKTFAARFRAPLHVAFDNFCEDEHTPWVHDFLGWREDDLASMTFESSHFDDRTEVYYAAPQRPHPWTPALLIRKGDRFHNRWVTRFDPLRTTYTLRWTDPASGAERPVVSRFAIYFVAESERVTWLHVFAMAKIQSPTWRALMPVVKRVVPIVGRSEVIDDARFIHHVADTPFEMRGMRLGRYDGPLIHNHRLLSKLYLSASGPVGP